MRSIVVEYGTVDQREDTDGGVMNMLTEVDDLSKEGWMRQGDGVLLKPEIKMVDCGFRYDVIALWLAIHKDWIGIKGIGKHQKNRMTGKKETYKIDGILSVKVQENGQQLWFIEVDNTKALVHDRYLLQSPELDYYRHVPRNVDISWLNSITAEEREYDPLGETFVWKKVRRRNDYLDVSSYNVAASYVLREKHKRKSEHEQKAVTKNREQLHKEPIAPKQQRNHGRWFSSDRGGSKFWDK
jgi:hypothetical protein